MKAAITGPTGHVGLTLARILLERGHSVRALVRGTGAGLESMMVERVAGDVGDPASLASAFEGVDVVFHTAARISITRSDAQETTAVNVGGTRNVLEACRKAGVRRLVHFSSIEALDPFPLDTPVDETRPWVDGSAGSPYALSKAMAEAEVKRAASAGMDAVILNPTAIIGPNDTKPSLLGAAIMAFAKGRLPFLIGGGFDWVDVRDVAESALKAADHGTPGSRYILGGRWASMAELAALACEADRHAAAPHHLPVSTGAGVGARFRGVLPRRRPAAAFYRLLTSRPAGQQERGARARREGARPRTAGSPRYGPRHLRVVP